MSAAPEAVTAEAPNVDGLHSAEAHEVADDRRPASAFGAVTAPPLEADVIEHHAGNAHALMHAPEARPARAVAQPATALRYGTIVPMLLSNAAGDEAVRRMIMEFLVLGDEANKQQRSKFSEERGKTEKALRMLRRAVEADAADAMRPSASAQAE